MPDVLQAKMVATPLPLPAHFSHAQRSFSLKKRRLPFSPPASSSPPSPLSPSSLFRSLPPRPPSKGCPPLSRLFPRRRTPWTPLSRGLVESPPPPPELYDPERPGSYFSQCFVNLGLIGRGSFGDVYKVRSLLDGGLYAVKRSAQCFRGEGERGQSIREAQNHERLGPHPHILGFKAAWEEAGRLYIQTELCSTSLLLHAEAQHNNNGEANAWDYLCDLLSALEHLHSQGFAHLDLKPANVFLTHSGRLKLGDFGLMLRLGTTDLEQNEGSPKREEEAQEGDPRYMAPELLRGQYGTAADIFSLGVSILELACNIEVPKGGDGWQQLRRGCLPSEITNALSPELQRVLKLMLAPQPRDRATVEQLLALPSVHKHIWRRRLSLRLHEAWMSVLTLGQSVLSAGWNLLLSLNIPFIHRCPPPAPNTPPRESWELDGDVSTMFSDPGSPEDEPQVLSPKALDFEHSPTFSHRIASRLSSTSTPLPGSDALARTNLPLTPTHGLHHDISSRRTATPTPGLSPIRLEPSSCQKHKAVLDSPASVRSRLGRPEIEPVPRTAFEPRNLITLFDETLENDG